MAAISSSSTPFTPATFEKAKLQQATLAALRIQYFWLEKRYTSKHLNLRYLKKLKRIQEESDSKEDPSSKARTQPLALIVAQRGETLKKVKETLLEWESKSKAIIAELHTYESPENLQKLREQNPNFAELNDEKICDLIELEVEKFESCQDAASSFYTLLTDQWEVRITGLLDKSNNFQGLCLSMANLDDPATRNIQYVVIHPENIQSDFLKMKPRYKGCGSTLLIENVFFLLSQNYMLHQLRIELASYREVKDWYLKKLHFLPRKQDNKLVLFGENLRKCLKEWGGRASYPATPL